MNINQQADANSKKFREGVAGGLNSAEGTKNGRDGNAMGSALKVEGENKEPMNEALGDESPTPLFLSDNPDRRMGNDQDEKDQMRE